MKKLAASSAFALVIATLALGAAQPGHAQALGTATGAAHTARGLSGQVLLPDGHPAPGALVASSAGGLATADEDGVFVLELPPGEDLGALRLTAVANGPQGALTAEAYVPELSTWGEQGSGTLMLSAGGGCTEDWLPTFGGLPGVAGTVHSLAAFDDGSGPALFVGGVFNSVNGKPIIGLAKWDGATWSSGNAGLVEYNGIRTLRVLDDGSGPTLFAGGDLAFEQHPTVWGIAKWSGGSWVPVGTGVNSTVTSMAIFDDGSGPALYVAGGFTSAGGQSASRVAKFDGTTWQPLGQGLGSYVEALTVFDDGSGAALYAGGVFTSAGGQSANYIAKWDGNTWSPLGSGLGGLGARVYALISYDDGSGQALYVGGSFTTAGGQPVNRLARWDGSAWSSVGAGSWSTVYGLWVHDEGAGPALYAASEASAGGSHPFAGGIARWDGSQWNSIGTGVQNGLVRAFASFDAGFGATLHVAGTFVRAAGLSARAIARWNGATWESLGGGLSHDVSALGVFDDGGGPALFVGGEFQDVAGIPAQRIARWRGGNWSALGAGLAGQVLAMTVFDDGSGPALFVGGTFQQAGGQPARALARWDGNAWSEVGGGLSGAVHALAVFDDGAGPVLYVGGVLGDAGGLPVAHIARWDGSSWSNVGGGMGLNIVRALEVFDDGGGPALFAGGEFYTAGGVSVTNLAKWNGSAWSDVGGGIGGPGASVRALEVFDDGSGPALYAGGSFTFAGGFPANGIARWNGSAWSTLRGGISSSLIYTMRAFEMGGVNALYVGGLISSLSGLAAIGVARWDGSSWSMLEEGLVEYGQSWASALEVYDLGAGPALIVGGRFRLTSSGDSYLAAWGCVPPTGLAYCFGDGGGAPCPCGNTGGPGEGCANGSGQGAVLSASGSASIAAADLVLRATNMLPSNAGLFFQGTGQPGGGAGVPFGDGLRCAGGAVARIQIRISNPGGIASTTLDVAAKGGVSAGQTRHYQLWYRDTFTSPCGGFFNTSNGLSITWQL